MNQIIIVNEILLFPWEYVLFGFFVAGIGTILIMIIIHYNEMEVKKQ